MPNFIFFSKKFRILKFHGCIWNQHGKCIKMNTNKPMFGPVVLEITHGSVINSIMTMMTVPILFGSLRLAIIVTVNYIKHDLLFNVFDLNRYPCNC